MTEIRDRDGRVYRIERRIIGPQGIVMLVLDGDRLVGRFVLNPNRHTISEALVHQFADRRKGITSALYNLVEMETGRPLKASRRLLGDGAAFWKARRGR